MKGFHGKIALFFYYLFCRIRFIELKNSTLVFSLTNRKCPDCLGWSTWTAEQGNVRNKSCLAIEEMLCEHRGKIAVVHLWTIWSGFFLPKNMYSSLACIVHQVAADKEVLLVCHMGVIVRRESLSVLCTVLVCLVKCHEFEWIFPI